MFAFINPSSWGKILCRYISPLSIFFLFVAGPLGNVPSCKFEGLVTRARKNARELVPSPSLPCTLLARRFT